MMMDKMDTASVHRLHRMHRFPIISIAPFCSSYGRKAYARRDNGKPVHSVHSVHMRHTSRRHLKTIRRAKGLGWARVQTPPPKTATSQFDKCLIPF